MRNFLTAKRHTPALRATSLQRGAKATLPESPLERGAHWAGGVQDSRHSSLNPR